MKTHRGMELPGFSNYRTFESIVNEYIEELEEPALKLLKDVTGERLSFKMVFSALRFNFLLMYKKNNNCISK